jgi:hypothetical protein
VQAPDFGDWHDLPQLRPLDQSPVRRILGEREVGPGAVVVLEVPGEDVSQVALAQYEDIVETLSADRPDQAFREGILPRASRSREDLSDAHPLHALTEDVTVDRVTVAEDIGRAVSSGKVSTIC